MEPIALAGIAVVSTVCISVVLVGFFLFREEKFEDHVAQQAEQEASIFTRSTSNKPTKTKKKNPNRKKKQHEHEGEGMNGGHDLNRHSENEETIDAVSGLNEENSDELNEKPKSILKEKKPKSKKQAVPKAEVQAVKERHPHFEDEPQPVVEEAVVVQEEVAVQAVVPELKAEPKPVVVEEIQAVEQTAVNAEPQQPKKPKNKTKPHKEKTQTNTGEVKSKHLLSNLKTANLSSTELQDLIDVLLNKQGESDQWKSTSKADVTEMLKKQLQEKEQLIMEEKKQSLNAATKLKEMRDEIQQERLKNKAQFNVANSKITAQTKELQAMQARMKASHDSHGQEVQTLQVQLRRFQEMVNSSSMSTLQRLQEENAQLKNASMRASQLTADKESLTAELHKLQQSHRQVKADLGARVEQLQQLEAHRQALDKQVHDAKLHQSSKQEAEKVLSKRLGEVNEELKKSEARESILNKTLDEQQKKCQCLSDELSKVESSKANEAELLNTLSKLTEATNRVSELENRFSSIESLNVHKDKEIQELQDKLKVAHETPIRNEDQLSNHVDQADAKTQTVSLDTHNELLQVKDSAIAQLNEELNKRNEEIANMKNIVAQEKEKNNDLRKKNWKAISALTESEKSINSQIAKAVETAKVEAENQAANSFNSEKQELLLKAKEELDKSREEIEKLEEILVQQKQKNNDLREKNWKAMDAVSTAEKSTSSQVKAAVDGVKKSSQKNIDIERETTKTVLCALYPDINIEPTLAFDSWLVEFQKSASEVKPNGVENGDVAIELENSRQEMEQLKAECSHYKNGLEDTESMLRKLENHIETEIGSWEKKFEAAQEEMSTAGTTIARLEKDLTQAKSSSHSHLEKINSLENEISQARKGESAAQTRISTLEKELANSNAQSENIVKLERELLKCRDNEKSLSDSMKTLESVRQELDRNVTQLSEVKGQLTTRDSECKSLREEMMTNQQCGEDLKKKISSLEEALVKANNDIGKSQESINSENSSSPEKKKKGIKGAFSKLGGSKKDKESKSADKDEAQKQITAYKVEIEELKAENKKLTASLQTEMTRSQQIEKDVAEAMADAAKIAAENKTSSV